MAKRFLDTLDDAFEEDVLADLIPGGRKPPQKTTRKAPSRQPKTSSRGRKKSFLSALDDAKPASAPVTSRKSSGKKKSFLGALEEVFEGMNEKELDSLFPTSRDTSTKPIKKDEARITTSIDSQLLANIRKISRDHSVPIKEVIQEALRLWLKRKG